MTQRKIVLIDVTQAVGKALDKAGFGDDRNNEIEIEGAGIWDLCDAASGKDTSKFTRDEASAELTRRGI